MHLSRPCYIGISDAIIGAHPGGKLVHQAERHEEDIFGDKEEMCMDLEKYLGSVFDF